MDARPLARDRHPDILKASMVIALPDHNLRGLFRAGEEGKRPGPFPSGQQHGHGVEARARRDTDAGQAFARLAAFIVRRKLNRRIMRQDKDLPARRAALETGDGAGEQVAAVHRTFGLRSHRLGAGIRRPQGRDRHFRYFKSKGLRLGLQRHLDLIGPGGARQIKRNRLPVRIARYDLLRTGAAPWPQDFLKGPARFRAMVVDTQARRRFRRALLRGIGCPGAHGGGYIQRENRRIIHPDALGEFGEGHALRIRQANDRASIHIRMATAPMQRPVMDFPLGRGIPRRIPDGQLRIGDRGQQRE